MTHTEVCDKQFNSLEGNVLLMLTCLTWNHVDTDVFQPLDFALSHLTRKLQLEVAAPVRDASPTTKRGRHFQGLFSSSLPASASLLAQSRRAGRHYFLIGEASNDANQAVRLQMCLPQSARWREIGDCKEMKAKELKKGVQEVSRSPR